MERNIAETMADCTPSTRAYASMLEYSRVCSSMLDYAGVRGSMFHYARARQSGTTMYSSYHKAQTIMVFTTLKHATYNMVSDVPFASM